MKIQGGDPYMAFKVYAIMSRIHATGGIWH
jgi:hypothetical protein